MQETDLHGTFMRCFSEIHLEPGASHVCLLQLCWVRPWHRAALGAHSALRPPGLARAPAAPLHTPLCRSADEEVGLRQEKDMLRATPQVAEPGLSLRACPPSCSVGSLLGSCSKARAPLLPHPACAGLGWGGQSRLTGS